MNTCKWLNSIRMDVGNDIVVTVDFMSMENGILSGVWVSYDHVTTLVII